MGSTIYTEVFVLALVLISNVLGNNFIGYIPRTATEIAARPQVPSPKLLLQVRKVRQQMMGCFALQPLQQSADRYLRRNRKEQMHMILRHMPLHYLYFVLPANVTDQVAHSHRYISRQRRPSVLRDPHQMQMNLKYRVRAPSVFWHPLSLPAARLLKPSPVRRGLQPSQTGTVIDHAEAYVDGQVHTTGWENFCSLLKRGINRTYVSVEPFHLFRYLDKQSFRYN